MLRSSFALNMGKTEEDELPHAGSFRSFQQVLDITNIRKRKKSLRQRRKQNTGEMDDTVDSLARLRQRVG